MLPACSPLNLIYENLRSLLCLSLTCLPSARPLFPSLSHIFPCSIYLIEAAHCIEHRAAFPVLSRALLTLFFSFGSSFSSMWTMTVLLGAILSALSPGHRPPGQAAVLSVEAMLWQLSTASIYTSGSFSRYVSLGITGVSHSHAANPGTQLNNRGSIY